MTAQLGDGYKSRSQIARRVSEHWGAMNLYCAACESDSLDQTPCNTKAIDFQCPRCSAAYQLKAGIKWSEHRVPDAGYAAMTAAIKSDAVPNLLVLQYSDNWQVKNLLLVPSFLFSLSAVEARAPLSPTARRAGWIGCNILLSAIAPHGKLSLVSNGTVTKSALVRRRYAKLRPLSTLKPEPRGWTLDVLTVVQSLGKYDFSLEDVYLEEPKLLAIHPNNRNIRPKIRQQLQVLRDMGFVEFRGTGRYRRLL